MQFCFMKHAIKLQMNILLHVCARQGVDSDFIHALLVDFWRDSCILPDKGWSWALFMNIFTSCGLVQGSIHETLSTQRMCNEGGMG